jgi:hypothetical protein
LQLKFLLQLLLLLLYVRTTAWSVAILCSSAVNAFM